MLCRFAAQGGLVTESTLKNVTCRIKSRQALVIRLAEMISHGATLASHRPELFSTTSRQDGSAVFQRQRWLYRGNCAGLQECSLDEQQLLQSYTVRDAGRYRPLPCSTFPEMLTRTDLKLQLTPAYGEYLSNVPSPLSTSIISSKATDKLIAEFRYVQAQATGSLLKFLDYITYAYMIDNIALLITGTLHERDTKELLERCHPLGWFETMPVLCVATNIEELYNTVLVETPLASYFKGSLSSSDLDELNIEIVRNTLYKSYLEDFYNFCTTEPGLAGTPTAELMGEILSFEADRRAINITLNSFGTELQKTERKKLYPSFGRLYPEGTYMLGKADDVDGVRLAVEGVGEYKGFFDQSGLGGGGYGQGGQPKSLEDMFYAKEMELAKMVFTQQFNYAVIFAWVKLREQVRSAKSRGISAHANIFVGGSQHYMDRGVHRAKPEGKDRKLHLCLLMLRTFSLLLDARNAYSHALVSSSYFLFLRARRLSSLRIIMYQ